MGTDLVYLDQQDSLPEPRPQERPPLLRMLDQMRGEEKSFLRDAQARSELRHALWISTMTSESEDTASRLRASELSAKADGEFDKTKIIAGTATIREMFLSLRGELKELYPPTEEALAAVDAVEELSFELVDDDELDEEDNEI